MPKIYCTINVAVEHEDNPKAAIDANHAILSLIRKAEKLGETSTVTHTGAENMGRSDPHPSDSYSPTDEQSILSAG